ncbi:thioesterase family protein [Psychrosphaera ytuae]|uniref:Thioesterase family protein n=1 Tax=Psychrosphaera ytuae TaxID=2820710 RepID=A0A975DFA2_9GAMM|nr:thioesterase family protein [Psychrosphaera ytuae]QTH64570.1 thioesterase family protein [Psychrosphaera ytuae]
MTIDQLFEAFNQPADVYKLTIPDHWSQGRTVFGGISAALAYQASANLISDGRELRAFHCNFVGPLNVEQEIEVSAEVLRTGKSVTQILAKVTQAGQVGVMVQLCFGVARESKLDFKDHPSHNMPLPKKPKFIPQIPKIVPKFIRHFDLAMEVGSFGVGSTRDPEMHGWCRFSKAPKEISMAHLIAMMDCWPPSMFQMMKIPAPASTMSWDIEFIHPVSKINPEDWLAMVVKASHVNQGYGHEEAKFWDTNGNLIALSRQVVTVFA